MLPSSLLQFLLPISLWTGSAYARSAFNIKAHGTGFRYATSGQVSADDIGVSTSDDLSVCLLVPSGDYPLLTLTRDVSSTTSTSHWEDRVSALNVYVACGPLTSP